MKYCLSLAALVLASVYIAEATKASNASYYWRNYYPDEIPADAFVAGTDESTNEKIYLAQAYFGADGMFTGPIKAGEKIVIAPAGGVKNSTSSIKILCAVPNNALIWLSTDSDHIDIDLYEKDGVVASYSNSSGLYDFVGRTIRDGRRWYGIMDLREPPQRLFHYVFNNVDTNTTGPFDILIVNH